MYTHITLEYMVFNCNQIWLIRHTHVHKKYKNYKRINMYFCLHYTVDTKIDVLLNYMTV